MSNQEVDADKAKTDSQLPAFISETSKTNYDDEPRQSWLGGSLQRMMLWISLIWFAVVIIYISQFFGWSNLFLMMPDEFGGFLAGVTLPLAIIWVVIAYIDRGASFKKEAKLLRSYMNQLVYPEDAGANTAKALADAIRSQVIELQEVTKQATMQTDKIKTELGNRVEDFARLVGVLDNYSSKTILELTEGVKTLVNSFDYVVEKAGTSTQELQSKVSDFSAYGHQIQENLESIFNQLLPRIQELKSSSALIKSMSDDNNSKMLHANELMLEFNDRMKNNVNNLTQSLNLQTGRLEEVSRQALENSSGIEKSLGEGLKNMEEMLRSHSAFALEYVDTLDKNISGLSKKFNEQGEMLGAEVDKIIIRAGTVSESISTQVDTLTNVSDAVVDDLNKIDERLQLQAKNIENQSQTVMFGLDGIFNNIEQQSGKLNELSSKAINSLSEVADEISSDSDRLQNAVEENVISLNRLGGEIESKVELLDNAATDSIRRFNEVGEVMDKHAAGLKDTASIVQTQSQISEASLQQQQRLVTNAVSKIDDIKAELKGQVDELLRASETIESNAADTVKKLQKQLDQTVQTCEVVIDRTKDINESLQQQTAAFDESTTKTISKAAQFEDGLRIQIEKISKSAQDIDTRTKTVSSLIDHQISSLNEATSHSVNSLETAVSTFEKQNNLLQSVTENTLSHVTGVVQVMDEKAEAINQLFNHQENEFFEICDKISENTNNIGASLKKQVAVIEQSSDRVFSRMSLLEENFNKHAEEVMDSSNKSIDKLSEIHQVLNQQNQEARQQMEQISGHVAEVFQGFRDGLNSLSGIIGDVSEQSRVSTLGILDNCDRVKSVQSELSESARIASNILDGHIKNLEGSLIKTKSQTDQITETLEHQKDSLTDIVNVVSTQSRLGEASMAQQYKMLSDVSSEVAQRINEINGKFKDNTDNIFEVTSKLSYEFDVLGDKLLTVSQDVSKASKNSVKSIEQVNMSLNQSADDLNLCVNKSVSKVGEVAKEYEKYIANFNTVTAEASSGVIEINGMITEQSSKMVTISDDTRKLVEFFNKVLNDTSLEFSKRAQQAFEKVKGLGENLKGLSMQIGEAAKMSSIHMENSSDKIRSTISEVASNAERISNEIRSSGEVFLQQSNVLVAATGETLQKVNTAMQSLTTASATFEQKGQDIISQSGHFNSALSQQIGALLDTSQKAELKISELEKRYKKAKTESFLKDASVMIEKLETMAVDMNRIFNPNAEEDLWKKYYSGDTAAFVRHLAKNMTKQQILALRKEFEQNLEFRNLVTRYMSDFEILITEAKKNERSGLLMAVISGADVGKLYFILAKALDKLN